MYFLFEMGIFDCYVSLPEGISIDNIFKHVLFSPPIWGRWIQFDEYMFFRWVVQPPTSNLVWSLNSPMNLTPPIWKVKRPRCFVMQPGAHECAPKNRLRDLLICVDYIYIYGHYIYISIYIYIYFHIQYVYS